LCCKLFKKFVVFLAQNWEDNIFEKQEYNGIENNPNTSSCQTNTKLDNRSNNQLSTKDAITVGNGNDSGINGTSERFVKSQIPVPSRNGDNLKNYLHNGVSHTSTRTIMESSREMLNSSEIAKCKFKNPIFHKFLYNNAYTQTNNSHSGKINGRIFKQT